MILIWAFDVVNPGDIIVTPVCGVDPSQIGSTLDVYLNDEVQNLSLNKSSGLEDFQSQQAVSFTLSKPGRYVVKFRLNSSNHNGNVADLQKIILSGTAIDGASTVIKRWRPLAVHAAWKSKSNPQDVILAVHENTIITTHTYMYQPITTPFGYAGSTCDKDLQEFGGFNFSLWSYSANETEPPVAELSHLIAVGTDLSFGEYGHEGTGVKPRGRNPYDGHKVNKQVLAVRKEPGELYDTYYSYYLHPVTEHWHLYGCGKKYNKSSDIKYLWTGAFVEVPGPPIKERSGHQLREVSFKGWLMDRNNKWHNIDQMLPGGSLSEISFKNWGKHNDNSFFMQMGGFAENDFKPDMLELDNPSPLPSYFMCV